MSGALLPVPAAAALPGGYAARALGFTTGDPWEGVGLLAPQKLRRELAPLLAPAGWFAVAQAPELPERRFGIVQELASSIAAAGPLVLFRRHPAWRVLEGATPEAALAASELGEMAGRIGRERDLVAVGDLLQTTAAPATPAAARWVRFHAHRLALDPGPLLALLRGDASAGITPLASVALGAALGAALAPAWPDAELEAALARACLEADGPKGAGTAAAPLALPPFAAPPLAAALVAALGRAAAGEAGPPTGLALEARLRELALARAGDLEAAARLGRAGLDPDELLALGVAHALLGLDPAARRRLWRRLAPAGNAATASLFPELTDLARLLPLPGHALDPAARVELEVRLSELEAEPAALVEPERERARAALAALAPASRAGLERLELWLAAGRPEAIELALAVARRDAGPPPRPDAGVVETALSLLAEADRAPFPPEATDPDELALLARFHALRARRGLGAVPEPFLTRLVEPTPAGLAPTSAGRGLDPAALAALVGQALTPAAALPLLARAIAPAPRVRLLLVRPRPGAGIPAWDALRCEESKPPREVCAWKLPASVPELPLRELVLAAREHPALELPTGIGPGDAGAGPTLVGPRLAGTAPGDDPRRGPALCRLVAELHGLGLALGTDPRRAARLLPGGGLGLAGIDLRPAFDPALREAAQGRDRAALRALLARWGVADPVPDDPAAMAEACEAALRLRGPEPPPLADARGEARAFLQDVLPGRGPLAPAAALALLPPGLAALLDGPGEAAELLRDLREEAWAGGEPAVSIDHAGRVEVARGRA